MSKCKITASFTPPTLLRREALVSHRRWYRGYRGCGSDTLRSGSISCPRFASRVVPSPVHVGQAPAGLLKEK
jgi:hypothetical protein